MEQSKGIAGINYPNENGFAQIADRLKVATGTSTDLTLAAALGLKRAAIGAARRRQQVPAAWIVEAVIRFRVSAQAVIFGEHDNSSQGDLFQLPILSPIALAAEGDGEGESTDSRDFYPFKKTWLECKGQPQQLRLMRVNGNAMEPLIHDKDLVLIDTGENVVRSDSDIFAVSINNVAVIKRIYMEPGKLILGVENKNATPDIIVKMDEANSIKILGRVVWWSHEIY